MRHAGSTNKFDLLKFTTIDFSDIDLLTHVLLMSPRAPIDYFNRSNRVSNIQEYCIISYLLV